MILDEAAETPGVARAAMITIPLALLLGLNPVQDRRDVDRPTSEATADAFRAAAQKLEYIEYCDVSYGRIGWNSTAGEMKPLAELLGRCDPPESVTPLLGDADARIRTLALIALFDREEPQWLPQLAALVSDEAPSFPDLEPTSVLPPAGTKPTTSPRTVGWCARFFVEHYLRAADHEYGMHGVRDWPGFEAYWKERKDRPFCASWLLVRQQRASGGIEPFLKERAPKLRAVRDEVDRLPATDRALTLLWLPDVENHFSTEIERIEAARSLGREKLLALLRREVPSADPDLLARAGTHRERFPCAGIVRFVLEHANVLLKPEDAVLLLELSTVERARADERSFPAMNTVWWEIAAAWLQPANAREIIEGAHLRIATLPYLEAATERADLLKAHWSLCSSAGDDWLAERFYGETLECALHPPPRTALLDLLAQDSSPRARATLARLVADSAFARLDAGTLRRFAQVVSRWTKTPIFGERELWNLHHPRHESALRTPKLIEESARLHPEATRSFLAKLEEWRARITKSLPDWAPAASK